MRWLDWGPKIPMEYLALIRIALGLAFLTNGVQKVLTGYLGSGAALTTYVQGQLRGPFTDPLYRSFLQGVLLPNADAFAPQLVVAELAVGLALVLGLGTRLAALGAELHVESQLGRGTTVRGRLPLAALEMVE